MVEVRGSGPLGSTPFFLSSAGRTRRTNKGQDYPRPLCSNRALMRAAYLPLMESAGLPGRMHDLSVKVAGIVRLSVEYLLGFLGSEVRAMGSLAPLPLGESAFTQTLTHRRRLLAAQALALTLQERVPSRFMALH